MGETESVRAYKTLSGSTCLIHDEEGVLSYLRGLKPGDTIRIKAVVMPKSEFDALPDVEA